MALTACLYLFQRRGVHVQTDGGLGRRARRGLGRRLPSLSPLDLADQWSAAIFGVDGAIVSQQQVSSDEGTPAFLTFERTLFGVYIMAQLAH